VTALFIGAREIIERRGIGVARLERRAHLV
jgi:hypothetical protein